MSAFSSISARPSSESTSNGREHARDERNPLDGVGGAGRGATGAAAGASAPGGIALDIAHGALLSVVVGSATGSPVARTSATTATACAVLDGTGGARGGEVDGSA